MIAKPTPRARTTERRSAARIDPIRARRWFRPGATDLGGRRRAVRARRVYHGAVRTRRIGSHSVTAIGSGEISLAISASRGVAARDVEHALHEAVSFGISLFDVAGDGDSEKLVGDVVRAERVRDRAVVATRVPLLAELPGAPRRDLLRERLPIRYVQECVERTLRATRLEVLPLAQLTLQPAWLGSDGWPELVGTAERLIREGKVLAWGAVLDELGEASDALALIAQPWLSSLSLIYQLCDRRAEAVFAAADQRELPILVRRPLAGGALAGRLGPGVSLPPRDDRTALDTATLERIAIAVARLSAVVKREPPAVRSHERARQTAERAVRPEHIECEDVAELALRFAIDRAGKSGIALPRLHRREYLLSAVAAAAAPALSDALIARVIADLAADPAPPRGTPTA
jgi:aryl-alcohol dehydrogenase-like predicted oxidoreductase